MFHLKRYEEALKAFETASSLNSSSAKSYEGQAKVFDALAHQKYQQFIQQAQEAYEKASELDIDEVYLGLLLKHSPFDESAISVLFCEYIFVCKKN